MPREIVLAAITYAQAYRSLHQHLSRITASFGLTLLEWSFLTVIADHPRLTMHEYAQLMSFDAPHITQLTQTLAERGLIHIDPGAIDKRIKQIELSPKGAKQVDPASEKIAQETDSIFEGITSKELSIHLKVLKHIIKRTTATSE